MTIDTVTLAVIIAAGVANLIWRFITAHRQQNAHIAWFNRTYPPQPRPGRE